MRINKIKKLVTFFGFTLTIMGSMFMISCSSSKSTPKSFIESYNYSFNGCSTEKQTFEDKTEKEVREKLCLGLIDEDRNSGCAINLRIDRFNKDCDRTRAYTLVNKDSSSRFSSSYFSNNGSGNGSNGGSGGEPEEETEAEKQARLAREQELREQRKEEARLEDERVRLLNEKLTEDFGSEVIKSGDSALDLKIYKVNQAVLNDKDTQAIKDLIKNNAETELLDTLSCDYYSSTTTNTGPLWELKVSDRPGNLQRTNVSFYGRFMSCENSSNQNTIRSSAPISFIESIFDEIFFNRSELITSSYDSQREEYIVAQNLTAYSRLFREDTYNYSFKEVSGEPCERQRYIGSQFYCPVGTLTKNKLDIKRFYNIDMGRLIVEHDGSKNIFKQKILEVSQSLIVNLNQANTSSQNEKELEIITTLKSGVRVSGEGTEYDDNAYILVLTNN